jgi:hypothetical protein
MSRLSLRAGVALFALALFVAIVAAYLWAMHPYLAWGWLGIAVVQLFLDYAPAAEVAEAVRRDAGEPPC